MLRKSIRPVVDNVLRGGSTLRNLERGVANGPSNRDYSSDSKLPSRRKNAQKQDVEVLGKESQNSAPAEAIKPEMKQKKKTMAEIDEELRLKLEDVSGEGGTAGVEYEGGKAVGLKRGVKENMFRII
ncbi:hypothetical protein NA56DRAFT_649257 [Hyaloscypha hepaticicola]|uniref:Uncharacterized protein n=1 Tax=Hyaloscypha hepaticicola TaxID=2082293 RepID=A0A2J6PRN8_9HELO|nr:hypothetical protein NA56DRAFT_649257 [Hyaloscypha hepaticicola]